jgi:Co/Zn/Cd efflux system component
VPAAANDDPEPAPEAGTPERARAIRRTVLTVAGLNLGYFFVEVAVALTIGSVSLLADSVDFLEDTAVNLLVFLALGWSLRARSRAGRAMAVVILVPAAAAAWQVVDKVGDPVAPEALPLVLAALGAMVVNATCALLLVRIRRHGGSMTTAAWLAARNDVLVGVAIIAVGGLTAWTRSAWPDVVLGVGIILLGVAAAREVWEVAEEERLGAMALAGEDID